MRHAKLEVKKRVVSGITYFVVWVPAFLAVSKKAGREYFRRKADAEARVRELRRAALSSRRVMGLGPAEEADAIRALELLADHGISRVTLRQAVEAAIPALKAAAHLATLGRFLQEFQEFKRERWREKSLSNFKFAADCLVERFGADAFLHELTGQVLGDWLAKRFESPGYRANVMRTLSPAFNWAVKRGVLPVSPLVSVERPRVERGEVCVVSPEQAEHALRVCPPESLAAVALMLFGGVRPTEVTRMVWGDVRADFVHVRPGVAKTAQVRNVEISETLAAWLAVCNRGADDEQIVPPLWRYKYKAWRAAAGISGQQDILRHSYATYHLAMWRDEAALRANMGHSRGSDVLFRHYRAAATPQQAAVFWGLRP